jgi:hypothetical protein
MKVFVARNLASAEGGTADEGCSSIDAILH